MHPRWHLVPIARQSRIQVPSVWICQTEVVMSRIEAPSIWISQIEVVVVMFCQSFAAALVCFLCFFFLNFYLLLSRQDLIRFADLLVFILYMWSIIFESWISIHLQQGCTLTKTRLSHNLFWNNILIATDESASGICMMLKSISCFFLTKWIFIKLTLALARLNVVEKRYRNNRYITRKQELRF